MSWPMTYTPSSLIRGRLALRVGGGLDRGRGPDRGGHRHAGSSGRTPRGFAPCAQLCCLAFHWSPAELGQSGHDGPAVSAGMPGFPPVNSWIAGSRTAASLAPEPQRKSTRSARLPAGEQGGERKRPGFLRGCVRNYGPVHAVHPGVSCGPKYAPPGKVLALDLSQRTLQWWRCRFTGEATMGTGHPERW
jgi:hypothetical protein